MANIIGTQNPEVLNGTASADNIQGQGGNDTLNGLDGADKLNGGSGADSLTGGNGNDIYYVDDAGDVVVESSADSVVGGVDSVYTSLAAYTLGANLENLRQITAAAADATGNALNNVLYAGNGNNVLDGAGGSDTVSYRFAASAVNVSLLVGGAQATGGSGSDTLVSIENLTGSAFNDTLTGTAQANVLDGGAGTDTMTGGDGNDTYRVSTALDVVVESNADSVTGGVDIVVSTAVNYALGANVENLRIAATGASNGTGNSLGNTIIAGAGDNVINGQGGIDTVSYSLATAGVNVSLATGAAQATGGSGTDTLKLVENLTGSNFNDTLTGSTDNNALNGGAGVDSMTGGLGSDIYYVDDANDVVVEAGAGTDKVYTTAASYTLSANVEEILINTTAAANATGNGLVNVLYAGNGNNVLDGAGGTDTVSYRYSSGAVSVSLAVVGAQATGGSGTDTFVSIENLTGGNVNDSLTGSSGANVLDGGNGVDTLVGGDGNDSYKVNNASDVITETNADSVTGGVDIVISTATNYALGANLENLRIAATGAANGTGNSLANTIIASAGDNVINGAGGIDTVSYTLATAGVAVSLDTALAQATGGSGSDTLKSIENVIGSNFDDTLTGSAGNNLINGGSGTDTLLMSNATGALTVDLSNASAQNTGSAGTDTISNIENLTGSDFNDSLTGSGVANALTGGNGADTLDGGLGADTLAGGDGNDTYRIDDAGDVISGETAGTDTVSSTLSAYTLGTGLENLVIASTGTASGTGNSADNRIYAGTGNNTIAGSSGNDTVDFSLGAVSGVSANLVSGTVSGGSGTDSLSSIENITGSGFNDTLTGSSAANRLEGGAGSDTIVGNQGDDTMDGGAGADSMSGAAGFDTYYVDVAGDVITDTGTSYDVVYSSAANYTMAANLEDLYINTAGAANAVGNGSGNSIYSGDGDNVLQGGGGVDAIRYDNASGGVTVSLAITTAQATGGSGTDTLLNFEQIYGSAFADSLSGTTGNDLFVGNAGNDTMTGADGNDIYYVDNGDLIVEGSGAGTGLDTVYSEGTAFTLSANVEVGVIWTSDASDITGNGIDNELWGLTGDNVIDGGAGTDTAVLGFSVLSGIVASLQTGVATGGGGNDTLISIENLVGSSFADTLTGDGNANLLNGGGGNDTLNGGGGADSFRFNQALSGTTNVDTIGDFAVGVDTIELENGVFASLGAGSLAAGNFINAAAAADGDDYIVYNQATGALYYDADGSGAGAQVQFASLSGTPALSSSDFTVT